ncbi:3-hydroxyisobutyryl-CoA hydrolase [Athelia psychrophila]|uniref:3-hydroxyisobutyryl-CoA hydrolase n=1 Tax=Athelia psychrophila TaxID=1759441 RepID=A0A166GJ59_9AGAM|nr:3-hydroxyisobutyryl-CoA hydrolase [Fibularhizoctonia sp. CBS 109695]
MASRPKAPVEEPSVLFENNLALRCYSLNRSKKLNALDLGMIKSLRSQVEEWGQSPLTGTVVGTGVGRAFCAGGDVAGVVENARDEKTRSKAVEFFKEEFELDYILAALPKPYVAILDGITMGGGVGLAAHAPFRIATENTVFAMPEAKIGYFPDVGASYFLSKMDGELGTYLSLTSEILKGRAVYEHGFATHFLPARRVPILLDRLKALESPTLEIIDRTIEELSADAEHDEAQAGSASALAGDVRAALDSAFRHSEVELILKDLTELSGAKDAAVAKWAARTLETLRLRSPTSLKVALKALRKGADMPLLDVLQMELGIATAFCNGASPDFETGVTAVLVTKPASADRPAWSPSTVEEVTPMILSRFFASNSAFLKDTPALSVPDNLSKLSSDPMRFTLPTEAAIARAVTKGGITTAPDLLQHFCAGDVLRPSKLGAREKVLEVMRRRCVFVDRGDGKREHWIRWRI